MDTQSDMSPQDPSLPMPFVVFAAVVSGLVWLAAILGYLPIH